MGMRSHFYTLFLKIDSLKIISNNKVLAKLSEKKEEQAEYSELIHEQFFCCHKHIKILQHTIGFADIHFSSKVFFFIWMYSDFKYTFTQNTEKQKLKNIVVILVQFLTKINEIILLKIHLANKLFLGYLSSNGPKFKVLEHENKL